MVNAWSKGENTRMKSCQLLCIMHKGNTALAPRPLLTFLSIATLYCVNGKIKLCSEKCYMSLEDKNRIVFGDTIWHLEPGFLLYGSAR